MLLLIEPDLVLAKAYIKALSNAGLDQEISVCADAQSAILAADKQTPDLVILELQLVEHSGIEFLYEFRSYPEWQDIPVLIHSVVPPSEFIDSRTILHNQLGVKEYLYKPKTSLSQLTDSVSKLLPLVYS